MTAQFGAGWTISTDSIAGGTSTAEMRVIEGGANSPKGVLGVSRNVTNAFTYPWAGVMFFPGSTPFEWKEFTFPLSDFNGTDGHDVRAILFTGSMDPGPFKFAIDEVRLD